MSSKRVIKILLLGYFSGISVDALLKRKMKKIFKYNLKIPNNKVKKKEK